MQGQPKYSGQTSSSGMAHGSRQPDISSQSQQVLQKQIQSLQKQQVG